MTYYPEEKCPVKKGRRNILLKITAYILGAAFVSVVSISLYDIIQSGHDDIHSSAETVVSRPEEQAVEADIKADNVSEYKSIL